MRLLSRLLTLCRNTRKETTFFQPLIPSTTLSSSSSPKDPSSPSYSAAESAAADRRVTVARALSHDLSSTVSQLIVRGARPSDSGAYNCSPSNTTPASVTVHVLDGEMENLPACIFYVFFAFIPGMYKVIHSTSSNS